MIRHRILMSLAMLLLGTACNSDLSSVKDLSVDVPGAYSLTYTQRQGQELFVHYCAVCHGAQGEGDGFNAYNLDPPPKDLTDSTYMAIYTPKRLAEVITEGGRGISKSVAMPAWGNTFRPYQIKYLVDYLLIINSTVEKME